MSEAERAAALKQIQMELFQLKEQHRAIIVQFQSRKREILRRKALVIANGKKECRKCHEEMDVEQFYVDTRYADGRYPYCIECKLKMNRRRRNKGDRKVEKVA